MDITTERNMDCTNRPAKAGKLVAAGMAAMALLGLASSAVGQQPAAGTTPIVTSGLNENGRLKLAINKSAVLATRMPYKRVSVGQPDVADVNTIGPRDLLVTAKRLGSTQLVIWDDMDNTQVIDITVEFDLQALNDQFKEMFPDSDIKVAALNGAIALRGRVPNIETAKQAVAVATPYAGDVLNFLEVSGGRQVMLQVRFAEVSRSASSALGINGNYASGAFIGGSNIGQINPSSRMPSEGVIGQTPPPNGFQLDGATPVGAGVTLYGAGQIGNFYLEYFVQALRQNNLMRILAEPNLITVSGQEANFLAGGEFPIPVTQGGGTGGVAVTIEYREFGVRLRFVPVVLGDGRIRLKVAPEVSDLDFTTAVRLNGFVVPGLTSRKVETSIELTDGQSFAIAGLLNNSVTAGKEVTPLLGDLPVVGTLFRSVRYQRKETELVVLVTPRLVSPMNPGDVPLLPGEKWRDPTEGDLFWNRDLGADMGPSGVKTPNVSTAPVAAAPAANPNQPAPTFQGSFGFVPTALDAEQDEPVANVQE